MSWTCFLIEATDRDRVSLRRYVGTDWRFRECPNGHGYHDAQVAIGEHSRSSNGSGDDVAHGDPRWPKKCDSCEYLFTPEDQQQVFLQDIYRAADGREMTLREAPVRAMWNADWLGSYAKNSPDGKRLVVKLPDGTDS